MDIDFGRTADDYGTHRAGFPDRFFDRVIAGGLVQPGHELLDLGTGTGSLARGFAHRGCGVTGLDPSRELLAEAARLAGETGLEVTWVEGTAEEAGLDGDAFDVVTAGQCWHWFDRPRAAEEVCRLLRPGGRVIIAHFDWIPLTGNLVAATEGLIEKHNPAWAYGGHTGINREWLTDLALAGFTDLETASFDHMQRYSHAAWRGRIRASAGVAASLSPEEVEAFDRELATLLARDFPDDPLIAHHRVWWVTAVAPG